MMRSPSNAARMFLAAILPVGLTAGTLIEIMWLDTAPALWALGFATVWAGAAIVWVITTRRRRYRTSPPPSSVTVTGLATVFRTTRPHKAVIALLLVSGILTGTALAVSAFGAVSQMPSETRVERKSRNLPHLVGDVSALGAAAWAIAALLQATGFRRFAEIRCDPDGVTVVGTRKTETISWSDIGHALGDRTHTGWHDSHQPPPLRPAPGSAARQPRDLYQALLARCRPTTAALVPPPLPKTSRAPVRAARLPGA